MNDSYRPARLTLVFIGLCFFFNPPFAVIDVLPDFIGCLLICLGLLRVAPICAPLAEARKAFLKVGAIDIVKNLALMIIFGAGTGAEQPTAILLAAFLTATVGLFFLIPAMRHLFTGFTHLAMNYEHVALYESNLGYLSYTDRLEKLTYVFLVFREIVSLLPEMTALTISSYQDSGVNRIYDHIGVMRGMACILVSVFGIYWLVRVLMYRHKWVAYSPLTDGVGIRCGEYYAAHPGIAVLRRHGVGFLLVLIGGAFLIDFYLDFQNIFPDWVAALLILIGALCMNVALKFRLFAAGSAVVYGLASAVSSRLAYDFSFQYSVGEISKSKEATTAYNKMWAASLVEFLLFLVLLAALLLLLRVVIRQWAGYRAQHTDEGFEDRYHADFLAQMDSKLIGLMISGFVTGLFSFLFDYIKTPVGKGIYHLLEFTWIFDFCASLLFAALLGAFLFRVYHEIKNRFQYD
ncbi:MAG: hypothetical protein IJY50_09620 [Clostridia bacterium]|nr:hypothetical protein [Clostridia bacterium]